MASLAACLIGVDLRDALWGHRIAVVADDEAHRFAVGREEVLHAALEVFVVEDLRRQIERVVVHRGVERLAHGARSSPASPPSGPACPFAWNTSSASWSSWSSWSAIISGISATICGISESRRSMSGIRLLDVVGHRVDAVEGVEHRPDRPADRDVEAVRFPVEVVADRAEEVVEIRDVVAQFGRRRRSCPSSCRPCCA